MQQDAQDQNKQSMYMSYLRGSATHAYIHQVSHSIMLEDPPQIYLL